MAHHFQASINGNLLQASYVTRRYVPNHDPEDVDHPEPNDIHSVLMAKRETIFEELDTQLARLGGLKWYIAVKVRFSKMVNEEELLHTATFHGISRILLPMQDNKEEQFDEALDRIMELFTRWVSDGSGWSLEFVERIDLFMAHYQPLQPASYIPTPKEFANPHQGIVNIKNNDNKCFLWSVLAAIHGGNKSREYRVGRYAPFEHTINMQGITYPVKIHDLGKFEKQNPTISVNVIGYENKKLFPLWNTREHGRQHHVDLLVLINDSGKSHYCWIKDMSHFLSRLTKHDGRQFYCNHCLHRFTSRRLLDEHQPLCVPHGTQKTRLPTEKDKWMHFSNYTLMHKTPIAIYADFESYVVPITTCLPTKPEKPKRKHTTNIAHHEPSGYAYVMVDFQGTVLKEPVVYNGPNVVDHFLDSLMREAEEYLPFMRTNQPVNMRRQDYEAFDQATVCHLCEKYLPAELKVVNHDHMTGQFLGAAHNSCNLSYKVPKHIPVFFHNLRGYDCHHLVQGLGKYKNEKISCIAKNSEKYLSITLESLRFLDSLQFLNASLDKLVTNLLAEGPSKFNIVRQCMDEQHLDLLLRKGVFPYSWLTDPSKLQETQLPPPEAFYNDLSKEKISEEDYAHAQTIWDTFNMTTMQQYHDHYLKMDVLLLADVFENFRTTSLANYGIDPCNVQSAPALAWNAMLKKTDVRLELLTDIDQHLFIEKGVRGGVAMISHRHATANNPLVENYDSSKQSSYLMYLDCNNLYGAAMSQPLPYQDFRWLPEEEFKSLDFTKVDDDAETGYIVEVDLHYPKKLHDLHNDYPLAPERRTITEEMLSPYSRHLLDKMNAKLGNVEKLLTTLEDKKEYVVHYRTLKLYLTLGMEITAIHRVLSFKQKAWLEPFISFNTEKRKLARNEHEKEFFKLMNNATYGKSLENVRSRIDFKLVANEQKLRKWIANPRMKTFFPFTKDLAGVNMKKMSVYLCRPVYVGLAVLDISKLIMYDFHYNWTKAKYGDQATLCMTDTDSLFYHIRTDDIYADMRMDLGLFDTSEYPEDHPNFSLENKKVLGKFKDEVKGVPPREIIGLRAKCYSVLVDPSAEKDKDREKRVAKGVSRVAIKQQLRHEIYKRCLLRRKAVMTSANIIGSTLHQIYTRSLAKFSLSPYDDKRYIKADGVTTLAYGHYDTARVRNLDEAVLSFEEEDGDFPPSEDSDSDSDQPPVKRRRVTKPTTRRKPPMMPALPPGVPSGSGLPPALGLGEPSGSRL